MIKYRAVAVAVAVSGGVAVPVAVPVAGLTERFFNQKDFLTNVWGYFLSESFSDRFPISFKSFLVCFLNSFRIVFKPF